VLSASELTRPGPFPAVDDSPPFHEVVRKNSVRVCTPNECLRAHGVRARTRQVNVRAHPTIAVLNKQESVLIARKRLYSLITKRDAAVTAQHCGSTKDSFCI
jgi:hypothetical protein